jgi:hypothetical protein
VVVDRIDQSVQIEWLREFLQSRGKLENDDEEYLRSLMRGGMHEFGSSLAQDWKYLRSRKVVDHVKHWAKRNKIAEEQVLVPPSKDAKRKRVRDDATAVGSIRRAVLAAVEEMPLSELENLSIPLRYVFRHFAAK